MKVVLEKYIIKKSNFYSVGVNRLLSGVLKDDLDKESTKVRMLGRKIEENKEEQVK